MKTQNSSNSRDFDILQPVKQQYRKEPENAPVHSRELLPVQCLTSLQVALWSAPTVGDSTAYILRDCLMCSMIQR